MICHLAGLIHTFILDKVVTLRKFHILRFAHPQRILLHFQLLRSSLVNNWTQSVVCDDLGMTDYIINMENKNPQAEPLSNILKMKDRADLVEAFLGALFVDKGLAYCKVFCEVCFYPRLKVRRRRSPLSITFLVDGSNIPFIPAGVYQESGLERPQIPAAAMLSDSQRAGRGEPGHSHLPVSSHCLGFLIRLAVTQRRIVSVSPEFWTSLDRPTPENTPWLSISSDDA